MMEKYYRVCNQCCQKIGLKINSDIESRCHRKYCDICGFSSDSDLSSISEKALEKRRRIKHQFQNERKEGE